MDQLRERVAVLEEQRKSDIIATDKVAKTLSAHVRHCSRLQTVGLGIGCVTLGVVFVDSPKMAELINLVWGVFFG